MRTLIFVTIAIIWEWPNSMTLGYRNRLYDPYDSDYPSPQDEEVSLIHCSFGTYRCADNSGCVQGKELCDYNKNCNDFSDERFTLCKKLHEKRGTCTASGEYYDHGYSGCRDIKTICSDNTDDEFRSLCDEIKNGLKGLQTNEEFLAMTQEISTLRNKISELKNESQLEDIFEHLAISFNESSNEKNDSVCPPLYVNVNEKCKALFTVAKVTWAESKHFCESISGNLAVLGQLKDYESLLKYLKNQGLTTDFWIGGHYADSKSLGTPRWKWLDEQDITMGAPYWSLYQTINCTTRGTSRECYAYSLAPTENRDGFCLALDYAFHYYFIDQNCHEKRSPLCSSTKNENDTLECFVRFRFRLICNLGSFKT